MIFMSGIVLGFTVQNMNLGSMVLDEMAFQAWATGLSVVGHTLQMWETWSICLRTWKQELLASYMWETMTQMCNQNIITSVLKQ